jgi:hypothetical protein
LNGTLLVVDHFVDVFLVTQLTEPFRFWRCSTLWKWGTVAVQNTLDGKSVAFDGAIDIPRVAELSVRSTDNWTFWNGREGAPELAADRAELSTDLQEVVGHSTVPVWFSADRTWRTFTDVLTPHRTDAIVGPRHLVLQLAVRFGPSTVWWRRTFIFRF